MLNNKSKLLKKENHKFDRYLPIKLKLSDGTNQWRS